MAEQRIIASRVTIRTELQPGGAANLAISIVDDAGEARTIVLPDGLGQRFMDGLKRDFLGDGVLTRTLSLGGETRPGKAR